MAKADKRPFAKTLGSSEALYKIVHSSGSDKGRAKAMGVEAIRGGVMGHQEKRDPPFGKRRDIDCDYLCIRVILCGVYRPSTTSCPDQMLLQVNVNDRTGSRERPTQPPIFSLGFPGR